MDHNIDVVDIAVQYILYKPGRACTESNPDMSFQHWARGSFTEATLTTDGTENNPEKSSDYLCHLISSFTN